MLDNPNLPGVLVKVAKADGQAEFPVVTFNGTPYVVANPGESFNINVQRGYNDGYAQLQASVTIDGRSVGYAYELCQGRTACFDGFMAAQRPQHNRDALAVDATFQQFCFAAPAATGSAGGGTVQHPDEIIAGRLHVKIHEVVDGGPRTAPPPVGAVKDPPMQQLPEGKKFFMQNSLQTQAGQKNVQPLKWSRRHLVLVGGPVWDLTIRYETADTLLLRKILDPQNPQHKALLHDSHVLAASRRASGHASAGGSSGNKARQQQHARMAGGGSGAGSSRAARAPAVKRERDAGATGGSGSGQAGARELVDLTAGPPPIKMEDGHVLQRDEFAVCDLAGARAPVWQVKKKQCITVASTLPRS